MSELSIEPQTQFNIYKIDIELVENLFKLNNNDKYKRNLNEICKIIINSTISLIKQKKHESYMKIKQEDLFGIIFKTIHEPAWSKTIKNLILNNDLKYEINAINDYVTNTNVSYILIYMKNECIYAMTGGYGNYYIRKFIENNYGLNLIPKLISKDYPVVKKVMENNLTGNRFSSERLNRNITSIQLEQDLMSIYKELNIQVDKEIANLIGITFNEDEARNKKLNIITKDSVMLRRSLSIKELKKVISKLNNIESKRDKFALNYFVSVKKRGITERDLTEQLINLFKQEEYDKFIIAGDNYESYYFNACSYELIKTDGTTYIKREEPIEIKDIYEKFNIEGIKLNKEGVRDFIKKWTIRTLDNSGSITLYDVSIFNMLQGFLEMEKEQTFYLTNGKWYVIDDTYINILNKEFKDLFDKKQIESEKIINRFKLNIKAKNEDVYNEKFKNNKSIIYAHTTLIDNVEIADLIFSDENTLYLMHNKDKFNGIGTRDLTNQILTSSEYLQKRLFIDRRRVLKEYYEKLCKSNNVDVLPALSEKAFMDMFDKKICFISGYLNDYKKITKSTYARYLTIELNHKLNDRGQSFIPMGIG